MPRNEVKRGLLEIFYKDTNKRYLSMPFNNLLREGRDLVVRSMDGLHKMAEFTIHASNVLAVDVSKCNDKKVIIHTDMFYMVMSVV